jgi:acyl-coenzyme A thioesterase PaaI-like protein
MTRDRGAGQVRGVWTDTRQDLVSYRYLGCRSVLIDREHAEGRMPVRRDMRTASGLRSAPLAIAMLDTAGINIDRFYHAACTAIDVHLLDTAGSVEEVRVLGTVVREARTAVFTEARFEDAARPGRLIGFGTVSWSIIGPTPDGFEYTDPGPGVPDADDLPPLTEAYEARPRPGGGYVIDGLSTRIGTDTMHHGPQLVTLEATALEAAEAVVGSGRVQVRTGVTRLVRAAKRGPFVSTAVITEGEGDEVVCRSEMHDEGADGALVSVGHYRLRMP